MFTNSIYSVQKPVLPKGQHEWQCSEEEAEVTVENKELRKCIYFLTLQFPACYEFVNPPKIPM